MRRLKHIHTPSGSLLIALLALFVAMGGSAVAASLITSKQIQDGTIQVKDISKKAQKTLSAKRGPAGQQGMPGPQGIAGPKGDTGAPGKDGTNGLDAFGKLVYVENSGNCTVPEGTQGSCVATCPDGLRPVGGGGVAAGNYNEQIEVNGSRPVPGGAAANGWRTWFDNNPDTGPTGSDNVSVYVICAAAANVSSAAVSG